MATLKERSDNWNARGIIARDNRHDKGDGYKETKHKSKHGKSRPKKKPGCPGNDGKSHIYVWIEARYIPNETGRHIDQVGEKWQYRRENEGRHYWWPWRTREEHIAWLEKREVQICAGCYKKSGKRRLKGYETTEHSWWYWD